MSNPGASGSIARFLGQSASGSGPFGLLGLDPARCEPGDIKAALDRQLVRVEQHPEGDTPEADDVRLALHAAAAQLLDPAVRWHLLAARRSAATSTDAPNQGSHTTADGARSGGGGETSVRPPSSPPINVSPPAWIVAPIANRREIRGIAAAIIAMVLLIGVSGSILLVLRSRGGDGRQLAATPPPATRSTTVSPSAPRPTSAPAGAGTTPQSASTPAPQRSPDVVSVTLSLRRAAQRASVSPELAQADFTNAVEWLGANWADCPLPQRRAANDAVIEALYAAGGRPSLAAAMVDVIADSAEPMAHADRQLQPSEVWPAAWSCGMLTRLARERSLPAQLSTTIDRALLRAMGPDRPRSDLGFEAGAAASLSQMPLRLLAEPESGAPTPISRWVAAVGALAADPLAHEEILVRGLGDILLSGPAPDSDAGAFEAVRSLTVAIKWRRGGLGRVKLLEWLGESQLPASSLHLVTSTIATQTGAEGVGPTMVLSATAPPDERSRIRGLYAAAWGMGSAPPDAHTEDEWLAAVSDVLARTAARAPDEQIELAGAVELSRLNLAARLRRAGDTAAAAVAVRSAQEVLASVTAALPPAPVGVVQIFTSAPPPSPDAADAGDGAWARSYLAAGQNIPLRMQRLNELEQQGAELGPVDAAVLAEAACFAQGGEGRVRAAAQRVAARHAREAVMAYSLLEVLPRVPRVETVSVLLEAVTMRDLPPVGDARWPASARRALLERLIEHLAGAGRLAAVDRLAELLVQSYDPKPAARIASPSGTELNTATIEAYWASLLAESHALAPNRAAPIPLANIEARRSGRRAIAQGPIQAWSAEQASVAELLAFVVSGEQPADAPRVQAVMDELARNRRQSGHIFEQIKVTERAMLRLWLLRLGKGDSWSGN